MKQNTIKKLISLCLIMFFIIVGLQSREVSILEVDNINKKANSYSFSSPISPQKIDNIIEKYKKDYDSKIECLNKSEEFKDVNLNVTYNITINNTIKKETKVKTINYSICKKNNCKEDIHNLTININLTINEKNVLSNITFTSSKNLNLPKCNILEKKVEIIDNLVDYDIQEQNIISKYVSFFNKTLEVLSNHTNSSIEAELIIVEKNPVNYVEKYHKNYTEIIYYICKEDDCNASNFEEFKFIILLNDTIDKFEIKEFYIRGNLSNKSINFKEDPLKEYMKFKGYYQDPMVENKLDFLEKRILFDLYILQNNLIEDNLLKNNAIVEINLCKQKFDLKSSDKKSTEESVKKINNILQKYQLGFSLKIAYSTNRECYNSIDDFFDAQKKRYYAKDYENIIFLDENYYYSHEFDVLNNLFIKIPLSEAESDIAQRGKQDGKKKTSLEKNNNILLAKPPLSEEKTILLSKMRSRDSRTMIHLVDKSYVSSFILGTIWKDEAEKKKIMFISNNLEKNSIALFPNYMRNKIEHVLFLKNWNSKDIEYGFEVLKELKSNIKPDLLDLKYLALGLIEVQEKYTTNQELAEISYKLSTDSFLDYADLSKKVPSQLIEESKIYLAYVFNFVNQAVDFPILFDSIQKKPFELSRVNPYLSNLNFDLKKYYEDIAIFCNDNYLRYSSIYGVSFALSAGVFLSYYDFISDKNNKAILEKNREIVSFFNPLLILSIYIADYAEYSFYLKNYKKIPKTYMYHLSCPVTNAPIFEEIVSFFRNNIINWFFRNSANMKNLGKGIDSFDAYLSTISLDSIRKTTKSLIETHIKTSNNENLYYICGNNFKEYSSIEKTIRLYKGLSCDTNNPYDTYYVELVLNIYDTLSKEFKKIINYQTNQGVYANYYKELEEKTKSNDPFFVLMQCYARGIC